MISTQDVIDGMIEVVLKSDDDFRKVKETLTRMGVASRNEPVLHQSAHILHRRGKYYIAHFKEMFALDGLRNDYTEEDKSRRNRIVVMLRDWGMLTIVDENSPNMNPIGAPALVKVVKHAEKKDWRLVAKYQMGVKKA